MKDSISIKIVLKFCFMGSEVMYRWTKKLFWHVFLCFF